jgi:von Willebrand factor type A domain
MRLSLVLLAAAVTAQVAAGDNVPRECPNLSGIPVWTLSVRAMAPAFDLRAGNFVVTRQGAVQQPCGFVSTRLPVSVGILLDTSGSMQAGGFAGLAMARSAIDKLLDQSGPQDEYFFETANDTSAIHCGFTRDVAEVRSALDVKAKGKTALVNAIRVGLAAMQKARHETRVLAVFSDGEDNFSRFKPEDVGRELAEAQTAMFLVMPIDPTHRRQFDHDTANTRPLLARLATGSGGYVKECLSKEEMVGFMPALATAMRTLYILHFTAPGTTGPIKDIKVQFKGVGPRPELLYRRTAVLEPQPLPSVNVPFH